VRDRGRLPPVGVDARAQAPRVGAPRALILAAYSVVAALQPISEFGRVYAAYGGVFIALSLLWGVVVDGFRPDRYDLLGAAICVAGVWSWSLPLEVSVPLFGGVLREGSSPEVSTRDHARNRSHGPPRRPPQRSRAGGAWHSGGCEHLTRRASPRSAAKGRGKA
jgi:drug/metabolite transporter superfamily protein YnfA